MVMNHTIQQRLGGSLWQAARFVPQRVANCQARNASTHNRYAWLHHGKHAASLQCSRSCAWRHCGNADVFAGRGWEGGTFVRA